MMTRVTGRMDCVRQDEIGLEDGLQRGSCSSLFPSILVPESFSSDVTTDVLVNVDDSESLCSLDSN